MGGLAPRPKPIKRCRVFDANLGALLRGLWPIFKLVEVACCKSYLFRPTGGFPSLWLPLLIRRHQRMRSCKECLQQSLPTNIFASLVVSKISKHKSYKFGLWKISYIFISMYRGKARSYKSRPRTRQDDVFEQLLHAAMIANEAYLCQSPLSVVVDSNDCFWAHSTLSVSGFAKGRPNMCLYMTYLTKIL